MAVGDTGRWEPGIGDPTILGWSTVGLYALAALLALRCARRAGLPPEFRFWALMVLALVLLGFNKQLDLQSWFTQTARDWALAQGWYGERRLVQAAFIGALVTLGVVAMGALLWITRSMPTSTRCAALGLVVLVAFVVIRGASFHHVDELIRSDWAGFSYNWLLEVTPLSVIAAAAWIRRRFAVPRPAGRRSQGRRT